MFIVYKLIGDTRYNFGYSSWLLLVIGNHRLVTNHLTVSHKWCNQNLNQWERTKSNVHSVSIFFFLELIALCIIGIPYLLTMRFKGFSMGILVLRGAYTPRSTFLHPFMQQALNKLNRKLYLHTLLYYLLGILLQEFGCKISFLIICDFV